MFMVLDKSVYGNIYLVHINDTGIYKVVSMNERKNS